VTEALAGGAIALTVTRPGAFSLEVNTRKSHSITDDFIWVLIRNTVPSCWLVKKVAES